jgi:PAS domain S-box-containing protein
MSRAVGSASPMLRLAAAAAAFASVYFVAAALTGSLVGDPGIAVLWPASGVYLGVMLAAPRHMWPALACAAGIGSLAGYLHAGSSLEVSVAFAVPSSAEGLLGALLVERIAGRRLALGGLRDLIALIGGSVIATALVALSAGVIAAKTFNASFAESWLRWWSADALGVIAVAPLIAAPFRPRLRRLSRPELKELVLVIAGVGFAACYAAWSKPSGTATLVGGAIALPFLLFAGWRWGMRAAALGGLALALVATHYASQAYVVQAFLAVLLLGSLGFAAAVGDARRARSAATTSGRRLRRIVDSSPDAYLAVDAGGRITDWSAGAEKMFGWDAAHAVGRSLEDTIAPGAAPDGSSLELIARNRAGRQFPVRLSVVPASETDDLRHIFVRDVTESERLRDELGGANAELERQRAALDQAARGRERLAEELHDAQAAGSRTEEELADTRSALAAAERELERLGRELALAVAGRDQVRSELDDSTRELGRLQTELSGGARELGRAQAELSDAVGELAQVTARSRALEQELETFRAEHARTSEELAEATSGRGRAEQELEQARTRSSQLARERDLAAEELDQVRARSSELERERNLAAEELEHVRTRSSELERERDLAVEELVRERARFAEELEQTRAGFAEEREQLRARSSELERERLQRSVGEAERLERSLEEATKGRARAEAERRLLGNHSTELISSYDHRGTCLYASPASRPLLGYEPEELVGRPGADLIHPDDRHQLARARATRSESTFEARLRRKDGDYAWVEVTLVPILDRGDDRLVAMNTTVRDISERRAAEEALRLARARFDSLFGALPVGSALLTEDGRLESANPALCRLTGYSRERLEGTALVSIVGRDDAGPWSTGLRRLASGEVASLRLEQHLVHASGRTVRVELTVTTVGTPRTLVAHFQDLGERSRARDQFAA